MGGFAEDAALERGVRAGRKDLDLLVERDEWPALRVRLENAGLGPFKEVLAAPRGEAIAFAARIASLEIEAWLCDRVDDGFAIVLPGTSDEGAPAFFRLTLPTDTFDFAESKLEGVRLQTVSPSALAALRAASTRTRGDSEQRRADMEMGDLLRQRFPLADGGRRRGLPLTRL
ncbi:MAG TPA: hypothetical protein VH951_11015 [Dehalococcoidia bacterium]